MRDRQYERHLVEEVLARRMSRRVLMKRGTAYGLSAATISTMLAACGGDDNAGGGGGGGGGGANASDSPRLDETLSNQDQTLSFLWFEWPPAQALEDFANEGYSKLRPNVTIEVNTVPIDRWRDSIFTQFGARRTDFTIPVLDSQFLGEAVESNHILDLTTWINEQSGIDLDAYYPYLLAAYGQYPQGPVTGERDPNAKLYGLPLLGDTWTMMYRKDIIGNEPPESWDDMIRVARQAMQEDDRLRGGLAFHQQGAGDAAAVTFNTVDWVYGGEIWNPDDRQIEGVLNSPEGYKAMDVLVNQMKPVAPPGSTNWFIDEVNTSFAQGESAIALNWVAAVGGQLDPEISTLGNSTEAILEKVGFATLPRQATDAVPLGGMGLHVSQYAPPELQAEALNFIKWFEQPEQQLAWAEAGGVPARTDALQSPEFQREDAPYNKTYADSVPRLKDFWNLPQYAQLLEIQSTTVNAALAGNIEPRKALDQIATEQQAVLDGGV